jgi:formate-dependent nitrite reductase membrane component NrfD
LYYNTELTHKKHLQEYILTVSHCYKLWILAYKQWSFIFISYYLLVLWYYTGPSDKRVIEKWSKDIPWEAIQNQNCGNLTTTCQFVRLCHHTHGSVPCSKPWLLWYLMIHGHCNIKFWVPTKEIKNESVDYKMQMKDSKIFLRC